MVIAEIIAVLFGIVILYLLFSVTKSLIHLIINSIIALVLLFGLNFFGMNLQINIWSVLTVAIGGLPGLILVVVLHLLKIAF